ncbi:hypothetical protein C8J25_101312 [Sphingomonas faeni]|uniref:Uncharacterized protein n=1 Tax=Sphingomonas faeni TaxID=185950 RepID=A0A2T5UBE0_9SPHN|nr:hypothetical protein C8J25_101312 [Sphingomonas faeni]
MDRTEKAHPRKRPTIIGFAKSRMGWRRDRLLRHLLSAPPRLRANKINIRPIQEPARPAPAESTKEKGSRFAPTSPNFIP